MTTSGEPPSVNGMRRDKVAGCARLGVGDISQRVNILGVEVDKVTTQDVILRVREFIASGNFHQIITANVDFIMLAKEDREFRDVMNGASLCVADGMPLVWAARLFGSPLPERVNGTNLMYALCRDGQTRRYRFFLLGAEPDVCARAAEILTRDYPGVCVAGYYSPPFGPFSHVENLGIIRRIQESRADVLLVGMSTPRGQKWIAANQPACGVLVALCIGGALDFVVGKHKRAPVWMQNHGLEWFFRLCVDFRRLWRRYLIRDMQFIPAVLAEVRKARLRDPVRH